MTRILGIEIAADDKASAALAEASANAQKFGATVNEVADKNIERLSAQRAKLRELAATYGEVAASAQSGSDKQIVAAKLAADAQAKLDLQTRALGSSFTVTGGKAHASSKSLTEVSREARGGIASFTGLGRAMFFASNAFLGGALIGGALKSVVDKTRATELAMGQLKIAVKDSGASWQADGAQIDATIKKQEELSQFTRAELAPSLSSLILSTGSVAKGEREMAIATDLARLKNEDLTTATRQVAQAGLGHTAVLRGLQIAIPPVTAAHDALKNELADLKAKHEALTPAELAHANALAKQSDQAATGARALDLLAQKTSGADAAFSNSQAGGLAKFQRSLDDLEVSVGKVLLPEITKGVTDLSDWMDHMNKTGEAQKYAKETVDALKTAIDLGSKAIHGIDDVTGSFKNTLELLIGIKAGVWALGVASNVKKLITGLTTAETESGLLYSRLSKLATIGVITIGVNLLFKKGRYSSQDSWSFGGIMHALNPANWGSDISAALGGHAGGSTGGGAGSGTSTANTSAGKQKMLALAQQALGTPYLWGGNGPGGFDCSGLVQWAFANGLNVNIPRTTYGQSTTGRQVDPSQAKVGDVVFTNYGEGGKSGPGHEGLIVGFAQDGQPIIEAAPHTGARVQTYIGYTGSPGSFTSGQFTVRDLLASSGGAGAPPVSSSGAGSASAFAAGNASLVPGKHKKPGIVSGASEIPAELQRQIDFTAEMVKKTQGETALEWVANEADALKVARAVLAEKLKGQSGKQAAATQREIDSLDKKLENMTIISGAHLLPQSLQDAISRFKTDAIGSTGKTAATYLEDERRELENAVAVLRGELNGAKGRQAAAIRKELDGINGNVATVNKQIAANLKAQAQAIKSNAASTISAATQGISQAFSQIIADADQAFQQATDDYISNVLGPQFYQGMQNPLEAQLAAMQAQDTVNSLQDALQQAKAQLAADQASGADNATITNDKKAIAQAERAIKENDLAVQATKLRAQEDASYAAAVKQWQDERALEEKRMNTALGDLAKQIGEGKADPGSLTDVLGQFGLTAQSIATEDMGALQLATAALAKAFADEAAALHGVGSKSAQKAADAALQRAQRLGASGDSGSYGNGGYGGRRVPQLAVGGDISSDGLAYLHRGERVLPASVVNSPAGGGATVVNVTVHAPHVTDTRGLAALLKSPQVQEAVATSLILASRGGHIRQGDIRP